LVIKANENNRNYFFEFDFIDFNKSTHSHFGLIPRLHILTLLTVRLHSTHMAPFSVNMRRRYGPEGAS